MADQQQNIPVLKQLLATAVTAQGERPADPGLAQMSQEDKQWLENAISQMADESDPVRQIKKFMAQLEAIQNPAEEDRDRIRDILEELIDVVCDLDFALDFCKLGGLGLIRRFLDYNIDSISTLFMNLVAFLAQHNPNVQDLIRKEKFLEHCMDVIIDESKSTDYKYKCVAGISALVKAHTPTLSQFVRQKGPDRLEQCFESALKDGEVKLVHRCAVAAKAIAISYDKKILDQDSLVRKVAQLPETMRKKLLEQDAGDKFNESIEFLEESSDY